MDGIGVLILGSKGRAVAALRIGILSELLEEDRLPLAAN
jgi:hypothetical protein